MLNAVNVVLAEAARQEAEDPEKKLQRLAYERESEARFQTELRGEKWESSTAGKHLYIEFLSYFFLISFLFISYFCTDHEHSFSRTIFLFHIFYRQSQQIIHIGSRNI